jgi:hypothetical protein
MELKDGWWRLGEARTPLVTFSLVACSLSAIVVSWAIHRFLWSRKRRPPSLLSEAYRDRDLSAFRNSLARPDTEVPLLEDLKKVWETDSTKLPIPADLPRLARRIFIIHDTTTSTAAEQKQCFVPCLGSSIEDEKERESSHLQILCELLSKVRYVPFCVLFIAFCQTDTF